MSDSTDRRNAARRAAYRESKIEAIRSRTDDAAAISMLVRQALDAGDNAEAKRLMGWRN